MLARASSFSRRSKRAPTDPTSASLKENDSNKPVAKAGVVGKVRMPNHSPGKPHASGVIHSPTCRRSRAQIVRSASFSRRAARKSNARDNNDVDDNDNASDAPRSGTPDNLPDSPADLARPAPVRKAEYVEPEAPAILSDALYGFLKKQSRGGSWKRRYFYVDESRGTLAYAKSVKQRGAKPSAVLPIADMTRIEQCDDEPCAFRIACPPIHLTVMAVSPKECKHWMKQLELRADVWRVRQREKIPVANVAALMRQASEDRQTNQMHHPGTAAAPGPSRDAADAPATDTGARRNGSKKSAELVPRPAAAREPEPPLCRADPTDPSDPLDLSVGEAPAHMPAEAPAARFDDDVDHAEMMKRRADDEDEEQHDAPEDAAPPAHVAASPIASDETVELYSDDDGDASPEVRSANRASGGRDNGGKSGDASPAMRAPAPVPLSAMISSDEEEDDEEAVAAPPPARRRGAMCQGSSSDDERANADDVDDASTAPPPVVTVPDAEAASTVEWDSDDDSAHVRPSVARAPESNIEAMDAAEEEEEEAGEPEPPMVMAAPGIVADENFADDDWDDDDM